MFIGMMMTADWLAFTGGDCCLRGSKRNEFILWRKCYPGLPLSLSGRWRIQYIYHSPRSGFGSMTSVRSYLFLRYRDAKNRRCSFNPSSQCFLLCITKNQRVNQDVLGCGAFPRSRFAEGSLRGSTSYAESYLGIRHAKY